MAVAARVALGLLDRRALQGLLWLLVGGLLLVVLLLGGLAGQQSSPATAAGPSAAALADIPGPYLAAYQAAAAKYGIDWAILAGIGRVECDHGQDPDPSCNTPGAENSAGAGGPMQFLTGTWQSYGVQPSGQPATASERWNYLDAIYSAANYLRASGAPGDYHHAIWVYNHADWYVAEVESWAAKYRAAAVGEPVAGGYINPLRYVNVWERTDMGVDATLPVGAPILAPGEIRISGMNPSWYEGQPFISWELLSGPDSGQYQYVAEEIDDLAPVGAVLQQGAVIARFAPSGTGIEYGWATATPGQTLAQGTTGYVEGEFTPAGEAMRAWLNDLGANAGPDRH